MTFIITFKIKTQSVEVKIKTKFKDQTFKVWKA